MLSCILLQVLWTPLVLFIFIKIDPLCLQKPDWTVFGACHHPPVVIVILGPLTFVSHASLIIIIIFVITIFPITRFSVYPQVNPAQQCSFTFQCVPTTKCQHVLLRLTVLLLLQYNMMLSCQYRMWGVRRWGPRGKSTGESSGTTGTKVKEPLVKPLANPSHWSDQSYLFYHCHISILDFNRATSLNLQSNTKQWI